MSHDARRPAQPAPEDGGLVELLGIHEERLEAGKVRCRLQTAPRHRNIQGIVHGSVTMALLDTAMGHAVDGTLGPGEFCATTQISFQFHRAVRPGEELEAVGEVLRKGRRIAYVTGTCRGADGVVVALAQGSWYLGASRS